MGSGGGKSGDRSPLPCLVPHVNNQAVNLGYAWGTNRGDLNLHVLRTSGKWKGKRRGWFTRELAHIMRSSM